MNKYLKSAVDRFNKIKTSDWLINPISESDAQIVIELGQIIKKAGLTDVCEILKTYKEIKDSDTEEQLLNWNIDHPTIQKPVSTESKDLAEQAYKKSPMLMIRNLMFQMNYLHGVALYDREFEGEMKYGILLNPTPENAKQIPLYSNYMIEWNENEKRLSVLEKLKSIMEENGVDFINMD